MAVYREPLTCPWCGEVIARGIYQDQSKLPWMMQIYGDTFIRWDYIDHSCEKKKEALKDFSNEFDKELKEAVKKDPKLSKIFKIKNK